MNINYKVKDWHALSMNIEVEQKTSIHSPGCCLQIEVEQKTSMHSPGSCLQTAPFPLSHHWTRNFVPPFHLTLIFFCRGTGMVWNLGLSRERGSLSLGLLRERKGEPVLDATDAMLSQAEWVLHFRSAAVSVLWFSSVSMIVEGKVTLKNMSSPLLEEKWTQRRWEHAHHHQISRLASD